MKLFDPFGWIAGSWDWAGDDGGFLFYLFALAVAAAHALVALLALALIVSVLVSFAGGIRAGFTRSKNGSSS